MTNPPETDVKSLFLKYRMHIAGGFAVILLLAVILFGGGERTETPPPRPATLEPADAAAEDDATATRGPNSPDSTAAQEAPDSIFTPVPGEVPAGPEADAPPAPQEGDETSRDSIVIPRSSPPPEDDPRTHFVTVLRGLDKITAEITELELPAGEPVTFGSLSITARACWSRPPEEPPETYAFLEIEDTTLSGEESRLFTGWMMASSPALNSLEHPIYDVWVIDCKMSAPDTSSGNE